MAVYRDLHHPGDVTIDLDPQTRSEAVTGDEGVGIARGQKTAMDTGGTTRRRADGNHVQDLGHQTEATLGTITVVDEETTTGNGGNAADQDHAKTGEKGAVVGVDEVGRDLKMTTNAAAAKIMMRDEIRSEVEGIEARHGERERRRKTVIPQELLILRRFRILWTKSVDPRHHRSRRRGDEALLGSRQWIRGFSLHMTPR